MYKVLTLPDGTTIPTAINAETGEGPVKLDIPEGTVLESCPINRQDND